MVLSASVSYGNRLQWINPIAMARWICLQEEESAHGSPEACSVALSALHYTIRIEYIITASNSNFKEILSSDCCRRLQYVWHIMSTWRPNNGVRQMSFWGEADIWTLFAWHAYKQKLLPSHLSILCSPLYDDLQNWHIRHLILLAALLLYSSCDNLSIGQISSTTVFSAISIHTRRKTIQNLP